MIAWAFARGRVDPKDADRGGQAASSGLSGRRKLGILLPLGAAIILASALPGCRAEPEPPPEPIRPIKILELGAGTGPFEVEYPGIIEAARTAQMAFEVPGRIIEFPVVEGNRLEKGQLIARLDPRDFEEALAKQTANSEFLKAELERHQTLFDEGVDSKQVLEKAQRNYQVSLSSVAQAKKALEDSELRAPFDGVVAVKLVKDFRNVQAKEQVVVFEDDSYLKIIVSLPEADYARITPGLTMAERNDHADIQVEVTSLPGHFFPARITEAANAADPVTRTFRVTLTFEPPEDLNVTSGMTARVIASSDIVTDSDADNYMIPVQAARGNEAGNAFVWALDPETMEVHRLAVKLGAVSGSMVRVVDGLNDGDEIAVSGVGQLREGMRVRRFGS